MGRWITAPDQAPGRMPVALVAPSRSAESRRALLRALAAATLGRRSDEIRIVHEPGAPPRLVHPGGLRLSSASRDGWAAVAAAHTPVGIDLERLAPEADIPWRVLHPAEIDRLHGLAGPERDRAFARLWTVKEAYLKALGAGFRRGPDSFAVVILDEVNALVEDPLAASAVTAESRWFDGGAVVVSLVCRPGGPEGENPA